MMHSNRRDMSSSPLQQHIVEQRWLKLTRSIVHAGCVSCTCNPIGHARWSGYLGSRFAHPTLQNHRILFVGSNHNGGQNGLLGTPQMAAYNSALLSWANADPTISADEQLLQTMRSAYQTSWPAWGAVWRIFGAIRSALGVADDEFAFTNLARCPDPTSVVDDKAIEACQKSFPLRELIEGIDARVIFLAKSGPVGNNIRIDGEESGIRIVVRYANGSRGQRPGSAHYTQWISEICRGVRNFAVMSAGQPRKFMLDSNIYDEIVKVPAMLKTLNRLTVAGNMIVLQTHIQRDELAKIVDDQKRIDVLSVIASTVPTNGAIYGISKFGQATFGAGDGNLKIDDIRSEAFEHGADALIGTTAVAVADVLVTEDRRLAKRVMSKSHLPVWLFSEFRDFVESLTP
jgi:hypothetical protein